VVDLSREYTGASVVGRGSPRSRLDGNPCEELSQLRVRRSDRWRVWSGAVESLGDGPPFDVPWLVLEP
jgi:hypothetical protein